MTSRYAVAFLVFLGVLGSLKSGQASFDPPSEALLGLVPAPQVAKALTRWGWREDAAQTAASTIVVYVTDLSYLKQQGFTVNALFAEKCPSHQSIIYIDPKIFELGENVTSNYIWHEFQHWIEWSLGNCSYDNASLLQDMSLLTTHKEFVETYKVLAASGRTDALSHFNHSLAVRIEHKFNTLPPAYRTKYFWYASVNSSANPTPTPRAYPPPGTATPVGYPPPRSIRLTPTVVPYPPPAVPYPPPPNRVILPLGVK